MAIFSTLKDHAGIFLVCCLFFAAGLFRLNDLSLYTPDSSRYMIWGNSIAHGNGFLDATQPDPDRLVVHAPLYSVLIAPVELFFPMSLVAVKVWTILWGVAAILLFYLWVKRIAGKMTALASAILLAANPMLLLYSSEALSEAPFVVFMLMMFWLCEKMNNGEESSPRSLWILLVAGAFIPLLREVGIAIVLAAVAFLFSIKKSRQAVMLLAAAFAMMALWYVRNHFWIAIPPGAQTGNLDLVFQHFVTPQDSSLIMELLHRAWLNLKEYFMQLGGMLFYPLFSTHQINLIVEPSSYFEMLRSLFEYVKFAVVLISIPLMFRGMMDDIRASRTSLLRMLSLGGYLTIILIYPIHDIRFLMPLLPLMIFYVVRGGMSFVEGIETRERLLHPAIISATVVFLAVPNLGAVHQIIGTNYAYQRSPIEFYESLRHSSGYPPMFTQPWTLLGEWIRKNIPDSAIIATPAKELATVVGRQKVLELDPGLTLPLFESLLRDNRVTYILAPIRWGDIRVYEFLMNESRRFSFEELYSVSNLHLLGVRSRLREETAPVQFHAAVSESLSVSDLLRMGREQLVNENYDSAAYILDEAVRLAPTLPEVVYQSMLAHAFRGDTANALASYRRLLTLPQSGSYIFLSRVQLIAMQTSLDALSSKNPEETSVKTLDAARQYWDLGYPRRAYSLMNIGLRDASPYFNGLLWGFHFAWQLGDRPTAEHYLHQLDSIDLTNPIVQSFGRMIALADSLRLTSDSREKGRLHFSIASLYVLIDLKEEAIDEAERALASDPTNIDACLLIAQMFENKSRFRAAEEMYREAHRLQPENSLSLAKADTMRIRRSLD